MGMLAYPVPWPIHFGDVLLRGKRHALHIAVLGLVKTAVPTNRATRCAIFAVLFFAVTFSLARADIAPTGDVSPSNPSGWTTYTDGYIGNTCGGSLTVNGGSNLLCEDGYIGYGSTATGVVNVSGSGSTWANRCTLNVGYYGSGTLNITSGATVSSGSGYIGYNSGSTGIVTVSGSGSTWTNNYDLVVGLYGAGTLNISGGGTVASPDGCIGCYSGSTSTVTVSGSGSTWIISSGLDVGYVGGSGTLNISNGGTVTTGGGYIYIGSESGSTGIVTVSGSGSTWANSGSLDVGNVGNGKLSITNGGSVSNNDCYIANNAGSTGTVTLDGAGSKWTTGSLDVGSFGNGKLSITNGGSVSNNDCYIANNAGSTGTVTLDGASSTWATSGSLYVGNSGAGTVTQTGGINSVGGTFWLACDRGDGNDYYGAKGTYHLNGGELIVKSLTKGNGTAAFNFGGGTLQASGAFSSTLPMTLTGIAGNANVDTAGYAVTLSGQLSGAGGLNKLGTGTLTLGGANTYTGPTTLSAGQLNINNAQALGTGTFTIAANSTIDNTTQGSIALSTNNPMTWGGNFTFVGTQDLTSALGRSRWQQCCSNRQCERTHGRRGHRRQLLIGEGWHGHAGS